MAMTREMRREQRPLAGRSILIVEDEMLLALELQVLLEGEACAIIGPVATVDHALDVLSTQRPDAATLDLNLSGEHSAAVAGALAALSIPFIVTTGYRGIPTEPEFGAAPLVKKPLDMADLLEKLAGFFE